MRLSLREKAMFYQHSSQLLRSGIGLPQAIERLSTTAGGGTRAFLRVIARSLADGASFSDALAATGAASELERSSLAALERTGRLDDGLQQLGRYYDALYKSRGEIIRRSAYPVFILHLGALLVHLPLLFTEGAGAAMYLRKTGAILLVFYGIIAVLSIVIPLLRDGGSTNAGLDRLLRMVPLIGKIRRAFALARFCSAYDMQLGAGVNVMDSLETAAKASRSGLIRSAVDSALPGVRAGSQVGPLLAKSSAFPRDMKQSLLVAEETGSLDAELPRLATEYQQEGMTRLSSFSEWMPRLIYLGVVVFLAYNVISGYRNYVEGVMRQIDSL